MLIGSKLKRLREDKRYSQQEIANLLDISQKTYSNFESDKSKPSITQLVKLSEYLEFDLLEVLKEQGLVLNQKHNNFNDNSNGIVLNNNDSNKLILQLETRIKDLQEINQLLKDKIHLLENN